MSATLVLPACLDLTAARGLAADRRARADAALILDASGVEVLGGLRLQLLLAARQTWARTGHSLELGAPFPDFDRALPQFEVAPAQLECGGRA